jgi:ABC-type Mn2+/Zn2+ transport system ATPase subunit
VSDAPAADASPADDRPALVALRGARLGYGGEPVLSDVDLTVHAGDFYGVVGPNGTGKTTLLRAILGTLPLEAGTRDVSARLGYAPQRTTLDPIYPFRAKEVVAMGLLGPAGQELGPEEGPKRIASALTQCGISHLADAPVRDLSGGQKQRVVVARALVSDPQVLVLDEPTNDLDVRGEREVMELLCRLQGEGRTIVMVTHLLHLVATHADHLAFLHGGGLRAGPASDMLSPETLSELFGTAVQVVEAGGYRIVAPAHVHDAPGDRAAEGAP